MARLQKPKYMKIHDIQRGLKYIFLDHKRPHYIQLDPKPRLVVLLHYRNSLSISSNTNDQVEALMNHLGLDLKIHINESMPMDDLFRNILKSVSINEVSLDVITPENLDLIEKHNILHLFSYTNFIMSQTNFDESVFKTFQKPIKESPYFLIAIDCEMMACSEGKQIGRITMVDHFGGTIYDNYIKPASQVLDYVEKYSGLNHQNTSRGISLAQMNRDILDTIGTNTFLLGHGLENDLKAMNFYTDNVIDTAYLFLNSDGYKLKLAQLVKKFFGDEIQQGPHSSKEDAVCCLRLLAYKIAQLKNFYDPHGKQLQFPTEVKTIQNTIELENASGIRMLEMDELNLSHFKSDRAIFYMLFYSEVNKNYIVMRQKNKLN